MYSIEEVMWAIKVTVFVSLYLLNTNRVHKSIELCKEHLLLLGQKALKYENEFVRRTYLMVYVQMSEAYRLIKDHRNAIKCGKRLLAISRETGNKTLEGTVICSMAESYKCQREYGKVKELCLKAISIGIETGEKEVEVRC